MRPVFLSTLASVAVHGAIVVVASLTFIVDTPAYRPACVLAFEPDEPAGPVDSVPDEPPPPESPRPDVGAVVEPPVLDDTPPDETRPVVDAKPVADALEDELPSMPTPDAERAPTILPSLTAIPPRLRPSAQPLASAPRAVPISMPLAGSGRVASAASVRGSAGITTISRGHPTNRAPSYPAVALENGWEGTTWLVVEVLADGRVARVTIEQSSGHAVLDDAAIDAVRAWTYDPALRDGMPVRDLIRMPFRWTLSRRS